MNGFDASQTEAAHLIEKSRLRFRWKLEKHCGFLIFRQRDERLSGIEFRRTCISFGSDNRWSRALNR